MTMIHVRLSETDHSYICTLAAAFDLSLARVVAALIADARHVGTTSLTLRED
jgi:hypothetical protein